MGYELLGTLIAVIMMLVRHLHVVAGAGDAEMEMIVCLTAFDRELLKSMGVAQDAPWIVSEHACEIQRAEALRAQRRETIPDPPEQAFSDSEAAE